MSKWICDDGHPKYLVKGEIMCPTCAKIERVGLKSPRCKRRNHTVPLGEDTCPICFRYKKIPWLAELDEHGVADCPKGHHVKHADLAYSLRSGLHPERRCKQCMMANTKKSTMVNRAKWDAIRASGAFVPTPRRVRKDRLKPEYCDWVVALRLIEGKVDEVYDMKRGDHIGPTAMEKWVAYHSTSEDYTHTRTFASGPNTVRHQWTETGRVNKWKPKTLAQAMSEL
jgi:hypothetical protein